MTDAFDILRLVAKTTEVPPGRICGPCMAHRYAEARHICWYLMHTSLGMRQSDVGRFFDVDRRAVAYGIARVEDKREDRRFDATIAQLEQIIKDGP